MLTTVQATYSNGHIVLDELPNVEENSKVLVIFLPNDTAIPVQNGSIRFGSLKGSIYVPDDFNEPLNDLNDYMY